MADANVLEMPAGCLKTRRLTAVGLRRLPRHALFAGAEQYLVAFYRRDGAMCLPMQELQRLMEATGHVLSLTPEEKVVSGEFADKISEILTDVIGGKKTVAITKHAQLKAVVIPVERWIELKKAADEPVPEWMTEGIEA